MLVVGTRGRGALRGAVLGSVSRSLATRGDRPMMVIRPAAAASRGGSAVVCGLASTSADALPVASVAADLATRLRLPLTLAQALQPGTLDLSTELLLGAEGWEAVALSHRVTEDLGEDLDVRLVLRCGQPAEELVGLARATDAAVIVVGCQGHGALRTLLEGSVSLELCRRADRPVVIVPSRAQTQPRRESEHAY
jgi:nucleotide-binding universal stress UspA family protein